jgi:hypothetical protein
MKKIFFISAIILISSIAILAQKDDPKPKPTPGPPIIKVPPKPNPTPKPEKPNAIAEEVLLTRESDN